MNKIRLFLLSILSVPFGFSQSYAPPADQPGTTAIHMDSSVFVAWATGLTVERGYLNSTDTSVQYQGSNRASFGVDTMVLGKPKGMTTMAVSLGDGGTAILTFDVLIKDGSGWDFAVFENSFSDDFLELAFVEVSSDGIHYFRFPAHTEVPFDVQINGFGSMDCRYINNFAGKYRLNYGTPFDLSELPDNALLDKNAVRYIKLIDVVGTINPEYASSDAFGNIVNDPFPTPFNSGGFDLTGVGVIHAVPDPELAVITTDEEMKLTVYPTVVADAVTIQSEKAFSYSIYSAEGKFIAGGEGQSGENKLEQIPFQAGVYLLKIHSGRNAKTFRLVK